MWVLAVIMAPGPAQAFNGIPLNFVKISLENTRKSQCMRTMAMKIWCFNFPIHVLSIHYTLCIGFSYSTYFDLIGVQSTQWVLSLVTTPMLHPFFEHYRFWTQRACQVKIQLGTPPEICVGLTAIIGLWFHYKLQCFPLNPKDWLYGHYSGQRK